MSLKLVELQRMMSLREQLVKQSTAFKNLEKGMLVTAENSKTDSSIKIIRQSLKQIQFLNQMAYLENLDEHWLHQHLTCGNHDSK